MTSNSDEQNQRTVKAIILCVLVAMIYTQVVLAPKNKSGSTQAPPTAIAHQTPLNAVVNAQPTGPVQVVGARPAVIQHPGKAEYQKANTTFLDSSKIQIGITHLGARVLNLKLRDYKLHHGEDAVLDMVDSPEGAVLPLGVYVGQESDEHVQYALVAVNGQPAKDEGAHLQLSEGNKATLDFVGTLPSGIKVTKRLTFNDDSYVFSVDLFLDKSIAEGQAAWLEWAHYFPKADENPRLKLTHITYLDGNDKIKQVAIEDLPDGLRDFGTSKWASVGDMYFMATLIPTTLGRNTQLGHEGEVFLSRVAGTPSGGNFRVYVGPKDYKTLRFVGDALDRSIDLGWFAFLAYPLLWLLHYLYVMLGNYGLAIIALTLLVKAVLLPISKAGFLSMKKMQDLQPEMKALRERIKDPTQLNQEIMGLYKRKGVNPMGGCFPIFIQIPVFLGLYQALLTSIELRHARFALWVTDLSAPESLHILGIGIPVMVLLMAASMVVQQWTTPSPTIDPVQKKMMMMMPLVFAAMFIIFPMPAGLVLYWLTNNMISIIQQIYMRNARRGSVYVATAIASFGIFAIGYIVTLI